MNIYTGRVLPGQELAAQAGQVEPVGGAGTCWQYSLLTCGLERFQQGADQPQQSARVASHGPIHGAPVPATKQQRSPTRIDICYVSNSECKTSVRPATLLKPVADTDCSSARLQT